MVPLAAPAPGDGGTTGCTATPVYVTQSPGHGGYLMELPRADRAGQVSCTHRSSLWSHPALLGCRVMQVPEDILVYPRVFGGCPALLSTPSLCPPSVSVEQLGEPQVMGLGQEGYRGQMVASCRAMWNESHSLGSVLGTREAFSMRCC